MLMDLEASPLDWLLIEALSLQVLMVDTERGALVVKGSVPGKPGCVVEITPGKIVGKNC